jgi:asparagine synthase (glutamine-hydrolysing)
MCGFVLVIGRDGYVPSPRMIERMTFAIAHRGPDDSGFWSEGTVAMGFRRLAIVDTTAGGHQPMVSADGNHVLVFNGEIFNYVELRDELRALGHRFRSASDSEVLLAAWRQWGERAIDRFVGMFAFAIWDRKQQRLFGARDQFGIKPLFVFETANAIILASEVKAIHASGLGGYEENWSVIANYLVTGRLDDARATCFAGVEHIPAGHLFRVDGAGRITQRRYHTWPSELLESADDAPAAIANMLEESVRLRTRADVPIGVCLSGGLDSTAIACAIARHRRAIGDQSPLLAFNYNTADYDESEYVAATIRQTGATLVPLAMDVRTSWSSLQRVIHFHDEPLHSMNALVGFELMRLARRTGTYVVLNGQGADETLTGYSSYHEAHWVTQMLDGHVGSALSDIRDYARAFGTSSSRHVRDVLKTIAFVAAGRLPGYRAATRWARRARGRANPWYSGEVLAKLTEPEASHEVRLDAEQRRSVASMPLPLYLRVEDRNSMAHGVEVRVPFLDPRLVGYALSLPIRSRMRGRLNKAALREGLRGRIPDSVLGRVDKMGFPVPAGRWFAGELYEPLRALIDSASARGRGLFQTDALLAQLDASRGKRVVVDAPFFRIANVESWLSMLADRRARGAHPAPSLVVVRDTSTATHRRTSDPARPRMMATPREVPPPSLSS